MKLNNIFIISLVVFLFGCENNTVEYCINDNYTGPCVIFIYNSKYNTKSNKILIDKGLARINKNVMKKKFIFKSVEQNKELEIIPIGKTDIAKDKLRYIFQLTEGSRSSKCTTEDLQMISFFIGLKSDYINWSSTYHDELEHFESIGFDWCKYYGEN